MQRSIQSLLAILILSASTLYADLGPGPSAGWPETNDSNLVSPSELEATTPAKTDSPTQADVAPPPPAPEVTSPVPMVIAGLAATAGVALLGLWIAKRGRTGNAQDQ